MGVDKHMIKYSHLLRRKELVVLVPDLELRLIDMLNSEVERVDAVWSLQKCIDLRHRIASTLREAGMYKQSIVFFEKTVEMRRKLVGFDNLAVCTDLNELGRVYFRINDNSMALQTWAYSLKVRESLAGCRQHDIAISLNNLGLAHEKSGCTGRATECYNRAVEIYLKEPNGSRHPDLGITYHNLGLLYSVTAQDFNKSVDYYNRALAIKEAFFGRCHYECAMTINNLGLVYSKHNLLEKSIPLYKRAISIRLAVSGMFHPDVALFLYNLGTAEFKIGNEASRYLPCWEQAFRTRCHVFGRDNAATTVVDSWISTYAAHPTVSDEELYRQVLEVIKE
jgi:tetratricopeptide (TPR) repeat protein